MEVERGTIRGQRGLSRGGEEEGKVEEVKLRRFCMERDKAGMAD